MTYKDKAIENDITNFYRTLRKFLQIKERDVPYCAFVKGKLLSGVDTKHRTRSGVRYNRLLRLRQRISK
jgi:hypothetical protein